MRRNADSNKLTCLPTQGINKVRNYVIGSQFYLKNPNKYQNESNVSVWGTAYRKKGKKGLVCGKKKNAARIRKNVSNSK
jgi:hypothetical protein